MFILVERHNARYEMLSEMGLVRFARYAIDSVDVSRLGTPHGH